MTDKMVLLLTLAIVGVGLLHYLAMLFLSQDLKELIEEIRRLGKK